MLTSVDRLRHIAMSYGGLHEVPPEIEHYLMAAADDIEDLQRRLEKMTQHQMETQCALQEAISRAAALEAERDALQVEIDEALQIAEGPSTLRGLVGWFHFRGFENARLEKECLEARGLLWDCYNVLVHVVNTWRLTKILQWNMSHDHILTRTRRFLDTRSGTSRE